MKLKKVLCGFVVSALAIGALAITASAFKAEFGAQFDTDVNPDVGEWPDSSAWVTNFEYGKAATLTIEFDSPVAFGGNYAAINTDVPCDLDSIGFDKNIAEITSFKLDGTAVNLAGTLVNKEGIDGTGLRLTICNMWNDKIETQPVDVGTLGEFSKIEVTFIVKDPNATTGGGTTGGTDGSKEADTGVEGVAILFGTAIVATGAVLISRKRK